MSVLFGLSQATALSFLSFLCLEHTGEDVKTNNEWNIWSLDDADIKVQYEQVGTDISLIPLDTFSVSWTILAFIGLIVWLKCSFWLCRLVLHTLDSISGFWTGSKWAFEGRLLSVVGLHTVSAWYYSRSWCFFLLVSQTNKWNLWICLLKLWLFSLGGDLNLFEDTNISCMQEKPRF